MAEPLRILHAHSSFNLGGKEARAVRLMNLWGARARHTVLSAQNDAFGARGQIDPAVDVAFPDDAPSLQGWPAPLRYARLARYMQGFDLVLSYNWGAMDAVMAHRLFSPILRLPPLVHHEDGFNEDEASRLNPKRNMFRRLALTHAHALVVPSMKLRDIARTEWRQSDARVRLIPNGIDVGAYAHCPEGTAIPGFVRSPGKLVVGTLAGLRRVKNLPRLVRAVAPIRDKVQLVIVGEGPERDVIAAEAVALGLDDICMPGFLGEPWRFIGLFDLFALSSDSEQFPISLVEAMAAGLAVVSSDVGDVKAMVSLENISFIVAPEAEAMTAALQALCADATLRARIGSSNHALARERYEERQMVAAYAALYGQAVGNPSILQPDLLD